MGKRGVEEKNWLHLKLDCNARQWSQHTLGRLGPRGDAHGTRAVAWGEALRGRRGLRRTGAQNKPACRDRTVRLQRLEGYHQGILLHHTHWGWAPSVLGHLRVTVLIQ